MVKKCIRDVLYPAKDNAWGHYSCFTDTILILNCKLHFILNKAIYEAHFGSSY